EVQLVFRCDDPHAVAVLLDEDPGCRQARRLANARAPHHRGHADRVSHQWNSIARAKDRGNVIAWVVRRAVLSVLVVALAGGGAAADPAAADRAAAEADALARDGRFAEAAARFRAAWDADRQRPQLFCNIGISYYK